MADQRGPQFLGATEVGTVWVKQTAKDGRARGDAWLTERNPSPDLVGTLRCTWRGDLRQLELPLPDECLDLVWIDYGTLWLSGAESRSWTPPDPTGATALGVRFSPGVGPAVLGLSAHETVDDRVPLAALWGDRWANELAEKMDAQPDDSRRVRLLEAEVRARINGSGPADQVALSVRDGIVHARHHPPFVSAAARAAGLSERQLLWRCQAAFGVGPARLARMLRVEGALHMARTANPRAPLARIAATAGWSDQQHLTHDIVDLFGVTPAVLLRPMSDRYKTPEDSLRA
jgi:AraC-like DNA-binding protein